MNDWTAFALGLLGSLHCAGMCGPLAIALPVTGSSASGFFAGRLAYNLGRIITYAAMGMVFGLLGRTLALAGAQRGVSITLGVLLIVGVFASRKLAAWIPVMSLVGRMKSSFSVLLRRRSVAAMAMLGLLNGFLPCGLVYVACAGATSTGGVLPGLRYMVCFGAGTVPMMLAIGLSGRLVPVSLRLRLLKAVPVSVIVIAALLILRGLSLGIPYLSPDLSAGNSCCHN
jgi:sulfite exporter TauE/SafE